MQLVVLNFMAYTDHLRMLLDYDHLPSLSLIHISHPQVKQCFRTRIVSNILRQTSLLLFYILCSITFNKVED